MKILTGMIKPTQGRAFVAGADVVADPIAVKRRIGYVPESSALYESLTAREYLELVACLYDEPRDAARQRIDELLERFDLAAARDQRLSEYSKGMKQKVLIASALMHRPDVLFLDEPLTARRECRARRQGAAAEPGGAGTHEFLLFARARGRRAESWPKSRNHTTRPVVIRAALRRIGCWLSTPAPST